MLLRCKPMFFAWFYFHNTWYFFIAMVLTRNTIVLKGIPILLINKPLLSECIAAMENATRWCYLNVDMTGHSYDCEQSFLCVLGVSIFFSFYDFAYRFGIALISFFIMFWTMYILWLQLRDFVCLTQSTSPSYWTYPQVWRYRHSKHWSPVWYRICLLPTTNFI